MRVCSLSVGIVTFESGGDMVRRLLDSLAAAVRAAAGEFAMDVSVHVVCNDDAPEHVRSIAAVVEDYADSAAALGHCELIQGQGNIGYGAAQNLALRRSAAEFHLVLNPDVVLDTNALLESVRFLESMPSAVMAVPQGFDFGGRYAALAKRDPSVLVLLLRALEVPPSPGWLGRRVGRYVYSDHLPADHPQAVALASGCFMFCRTGALQAVGGFDAGYFLYFEDYDLSRRIAAHGGIFEVPAVRIRHRGGHTMRRDIRRISRFLHSGMRYFNRYGWRFF